MSIRLTWEDINPGEDGFRVYRSTATMDPQALPAPIATLAPDVFEFEDITVSEETEYFYRVSAFKGALEAVSGEVTITSGSTSPTWPVSIEDVDLATFTEVDPNGRLTVSTTKVTVLNMQRNESCYLYLDLGADDAVSGDFEIWFEVGSINFQTAGYASLVGLSKTIGPLNEGSDIIESNIYRSSGGYLIRALQIDDNTLDFNEVTIPVATYFCKLVRDIAGDSLTLYMAVSSSNRDSGSWAYTVSVSGVSTDAFRYLYVVSSPNLSTTITSSFYIDHVSLYAE